DWALYSGLYSATERFTWTIQDAMLSQTIVDMYFTSPASNVTFDMSTLPIQISGTQELCFQIWSQDWTGAIGSICRICEIIDVCPPPSDPDLNNQGDQILEFENSEVNTVGLIEDFNSSSSQKARVSPNPSNGLFKLNNLYGISQIAVMDLTGRVVFSTIVNSNSYNLDIE